MECKNCGKNVLNGANFCTRKCRKLYIKERSIKGAKKRALRGDFDINLHWVTVFDHEGNSYSDQ